MLWTIALQSKELRFSTQELRHSADALRAQNDTLKLQNFEATFFQLLRLHNDIVNGIEIGDGKGRNSFRFLSYELRSSLTKRNALKEITAMRATYIEFYQKHQHGIGHYFRLLYNIIKLVDTSTVPNKRFYTNLVRAQLSTQELELLFFNCLSSWGGNFRPLVERFTLLKTLPRGDFPSEELRTLYKPTAFITPSVSQRE